MDDNIVFFCVLAAIFAFVFLTIFLIYKCCIYLFWMDRDTRGLSYRTPNYHSYFRDLFACNRLDLRGYGIDAAITRLGQYLYNRRREGRRDYVRVITQPTLDSIHYRPVLRLAVTNWLNENGYSYEINEGGFIVYL